MITLDMFSDTLLNPDAAVPALRLREAVPYGPGYYAIWIDSAQSLPSPFSSHLETRASRLLYVGIGSRSLYERLYEQEFRHKKPATFFRSIGAVLGYRPTAGSLRGKSNQNNYKFSAADTDVIVRWINSHLSATFETVGSIVPGVESQIIQKALPLLNIQHNPAVCDDVVRIRDECRRIARGI